MVSEKIKNINAWEILDSRGWPTIECVVTLENGRQGMASVPAGASTGTYEAVELRDGDQRRYAGNGVLQAIQNIKSIITPALCGREPDVSSCDKIMRELDGTENKSNLGANAILAVSMSILRAEAKLVGVPLYRLIMKRFDIECVKVPQVMFNVLNGGVHAPNSLAFQEFMIMPVNCRTFSEALHRAASVYHALEKILAEQNLLSGLGDEGGFAPMLQGKDEMPEKRALDLLVEAVDRAGLQLSKEILFCLDIAATQFFSVKEGIYQVHGEKMTSHRLIDLYEKLVAAYPIFSIEDPIAEDDLRGWCEVTQRLGNKVQIVGDDLFVSNTKRIREGISQKAANAALIKPNQVGTVSETFEAINACKNGGYKTIISHRSGETLDTFIIDLAVGVDAGFCKAGAPARGERVAKYNRLLRIEAEN